MELHGPDASLVEATDLPQGELRQLEELLADFAPEGYENGEGGYGTVTFDVKNGKIRVENSWYETLSHADDPQEF